MTDKQIIIDGKECKYWFRPNPTDYRKCSLRGQDDNCDEIKDCFVKELLGKLKVVEIAENAKFINADKMYKIPGSSIMIVNEYLKHMFSGTPEKFDIRYTLKTVEFISELSKSFNPENFEEIK